MLRFPSDDHGNKIFHVSAKTGTRDNSYVICQLSKELINHRSILIIGLAKAARLSFILPIDFLVI